jgi:uncharacterized surface protein with fasciclin (FAS1) repeats
MKNIVETAASAVKAAGLAETLSGPGPFTVFTLTDEAFAKLPKGTVEGLLKDIPKPKGILTCHVVSGKMKASDVLKAKSPKTVQGQSIAISVNGGPKANNANIVKTDIETSNGIIRVLDNVLLPN